MNIENSTMIINAAWKSETRLAVINANGRLTNLEIDNKLSQNQKRMKGNIYIGEIVDVQKHLEAAFVRYSTEDTRHGFLPFKEIADKYLPQTDDNKSANIYEKLKVGDRLLIQVVKDERGTKGAALTTFISIPGTYLVLMPENTNSNGISKRIEHNEREKLKTTLNQLKKPENMSIILRTAAIGKTVEELEWDLSNLLNHWQAIQESSNEKPNQTLLHSESSPILRGMRDLLRKNISSIVVDDEKTYEKVKEYAMMTRPEYVDSVKLHSSKLPLFSHYQIENQIEELLNREVNLPSGGKLCIDKTEALTACDVNSARSTKGSDIEATALATNLEAAQALSEQIRLRDIGGIIAVDFIDMANKSNRAKVEQAFIHATQADLARIKTVPICQVTGCMLFIRQKMGSTIYESVTTEQTRTVESHASRILRLIEQNIAGISNIENIQVQLSTKAATYILNEKRELVHELEKKYNTQIYIIPNNGFSNEEHQIKTLKSAPNSYSYSNLAQTSKPLYQPTPNHKEPQTPSVERKYKKSHPSKKTSLFEIVCKWFNCKKTTDNSKQPTQKKETHTKRVQQRYDSQKRQGSQPNKHNTQRRRRSPVSRGKSRVDSDNASKSTEINS